MSLTKESMFPLIYTFYFLLVPSVERANATNVVWNHWQDFQQWRVVSQTVTSYEYFNYCIQEGTQ